MSRAVLEGCGHDAGQPTAVPLRGPAGLPGPADLRRGCSAALRRPGRGRAASWRRASAVHREGQDSGRVAAVANARRGRSGRVLADDLARSGPPAVSCAGPGWVDESGRRRAAGHGRRAGPVAAGHGPPLGGRYRAGSRWNVIAEETGRDCNFLTTCSPALAFSGSVVLYATRLSGCLGPLCVTLTPDDAVTVLLQLASGVTGALTLTLAKVTTDQPLVTAGLQDRALKISSRLGSRPDAPRRCDGRRTGLPGRSRAPGCSGPPTSGRSRRAWACGRPSGSARTS